MYIFFSYKQLDQKNPDKLNHREVKSLFKNCFYMSLSVA